MFLEFWTEAMHFLNVSRATGFIQIILIYALQDNLKENMKCYYSRA